VSDLDKLAKSLTAAQREAVVRTTGDDRGRYKFAVGSSRGIPTELKARWIDGSYLTPLGLALRAHLKGQSDEG
jgi:hypothetical protein